MKPGYKYYRLAFAIYLAIVFFLCLHVFKSTPSVPSYFFGIPSDKVIHFLMFLPFTPLAFKCIDRKKSANKNAFVTAMCILFAGVIIAASTEILQGFVPGRCTELLDFAADSTAILFGAVITCLYDLFSRRGIKQGE